MNITIKTIQKRLKLIPESYNMHTFNSFIDRADKAIKSKDPNKIMKVIETGVNDSTGSVYLSTIVELFDALAVYGTTSNLRQYGNMICERYIPKVRDAKEAQTNLKRKLGNMKSKTSTRVKSNFDDISGMIYGTIHAAQDNLHKNIGQIKSNVNNGLPSRKSNKDTAAKVEMYFNSYENMINECTKMIYCDRILENYNRISKRFNIDRLVQENIYSNSIDDTINEICKLIETYDMPDKVKYNTTLETVWYAFNKNYVDCNNSGIVNAVTDYYLAKGNNRDMCAKLLEASMIVDKDDYHSDLEMIQEEEPEESLTEASKKPPRLNVKEEKDLLAKFEADINNIVKKLIEFVNSEKKANNKSIYAKIKVIPGPKLKKGNALILEPDGKNVKETQWYYPFIYTLATAKFDNYKESEIKKIETDFNKILHSVNNSINCLIDVLDNGKCIIKTQFEYRKTPAPSVNENTIQDSIRNYIAGTNEITRIKLMNENVSFNKLFNDFKASDDEHKETKLQFLVRKLYSKNVDDIVQGTPNLLNYIRIVFVLGPVLIHPILGAVSAIADIFISLHVKRKEAESMIKCFDKEIENVNKKLKTTTDIEEKNRLKSYKKELEKGRQKIDEYYEENLTDAEIEQKYDSDSDAKDTFSNIIKDDDDEENSSDDGDEDSSDDDDDTFNFDDDDEDWGDLDEAVRLIPRVGSLLESNISLPLQTIDAEDLNTMVNTAPKFSNDLALVSIWRPDIINPDDLKTILANRISDIRKENRKELNLSNYNIIDALSEALYMLENTKPKNIDISDHNIFDEAFKLKTSNDILNVLYAVKNSCDYYHPLIEGSFTNSITLASQKLKKTIQSMSDKERTISKNIDVAANNTKKAVEQSLTNDNREAIIKGSVLPSASKAIKLAITGAGLCLIDPVLAVIGVLGFIGVNKKYKAKERQFVLDEIEIELKMCEKYIDIAEGKNDMKALKKLLQIQRELERQRQRIKYKMKVDFGQNPYSTEHSPASTLED